VFILSGVPPPCPILIALSVLGSKFVLNLPLTLIKSAAASPSVILPLSVVEPSTLRAFLTVTVESFITRRSLPPVICMIVSAALEAKPHPSPNAIPVPLASLSLLASMNLV